MASASASMADTVRSVFPSLDEPVQEYMASVLAETSVTTVDEVR